MVNKPEALAAYPHIFPLTVLWNDMDAMQHVNNTVYFRYMESARIAFFHRAAESLPQVAKNNISTGMALGEVRCRFKASLSYPDNIYIGTGVGEIGESHFILVQEIYSDTLGFVAAEGDARMVRYDYTQKKKVSIEGDYLEQLKSLQLVK